MVLPRRGEDEAGAGYGDEELSTTGLVEREILIDRLRCLSLTFVFTDISSRFVYLDANNAFGRS